MRTKYADRKLQDAAQYMDRKCSAIQAEDNFKVCRILIRDESRAFFKVLIYFSF